MKDYDYDKQTKPVDLAKALKGITPEVWEKLKEINKKYSIKQHMRDFADDYNKYKVGKLVVCCLLNYWNNAEENSYDDF